MKIVIQRVKHSSVEINKEIHGQIEKGFMVLVGFASTDNTTIIDKMIDKLINLRVFEDEQGKMNLSLLDIKGSILSISQFTLYADVKKGNRPGFTNSMPPDKANEFYEKLNDAIRAYGINVLTGEFGTDMLVNIANDGPVTIIYESQDGKIV